VDAYAPNEGFPLAFAYNVRGDKRASERGPRPRHRGRGLANQRHRGFIEGQNLKVEYRAFGLHPDLLPQYATELVHARVASRAGPVAARVRESRNGMTIGGGVSAEARAIGAELIRGGVSLRIMSNCKLRGVCLRFLHWYLDRIL
jgi:hypothetical protein